MVVNNPNIFGAVLAPAKTNSPLVVDANAVLSLPIAFQRFKPIRRWCQQVPQFRCIVQHLQFAYCDDIDIGKSPDAFSALQRPLCYCV
jgi:hypothetical protein